MKRLMVLYINCIFYLKSELLITFIRISSSAITELDMEIVTTPSSRDREILIRLKVKLKYFFFN